MDQSQTHVDEAKGENRQEKAASVEKISSNVTRSTSSRSTVSTVKHRRSARPLMLPLGPVTLCVVSVLLIALMAVLYLSQIGQAMATNQQLQDIKVQQAELTRENQDLTSTIAHQRSPDYLAQKAKELGLEPTKPEHLWIITVADYLQQLSQDQ